MLIGSSVFLRQSQISSKAKPRKDYHIMKKILTIILCAALLFVMCASLSSCASKTTNPIDFGKKYIYEDENGYYYTFNSDGTGIYEVKYVHESTVDPKYNFTMSGRVEFVWREASDGAVYLFEVKTHYNEDHTGERNLGVTDAAIYFSDDFLVISKSRYIKEGSDLDKILKDK